MGRVCEGRKTIPACWVDFGSEKEKGKNGWRRGSVSRSEGKEEDNMKTGRLRERERNRRKKHICLFLLIDFNVGKTYQEKRR